uniref:Ovule protein n=1 Tax=Bursaphelenchus xylophilus TaxID=6326 RepID=A0A1I7SHZ3_BURXY
SNLGLLPFSRSFDFILVVVNSRLAPSSSPTPRLRCNWKLRNNRLL